MFSVRTFGETTLILVPEHASQSPKKQTQAEFTEQLWVPWWWWPLGLVASSLVATQFALGISALPAWLPYVVLAPVPIWVLWYLSRTKLRVTHHGPEGPALHVGDAYLPTSVIARTAVIPPSAKRAAMGRQLDPAAYVQHRNWVRPMVLVVLDDPDDPTPYWLVSTRRPERLIEAIDSAIRR
ncbi:DUF3093 domain-containing protein [Hoyosella altamirensis]|uniref:DUF3093 domain-containing protein n=1 Tax=Hoyosella altamirensis TaxID=616997 RepID=UPI000A071A5F|nr:DUF3093 domain-containing protein [Hoyosella altamirensis]